MKRIDKYSTAANMALGAKNARFGLKDGSVVSGKVINVESKNDDPEYGGSIYVAANNKGESNAIVIPSEFAWAEFDD